MATIVTRVGKGSPLTFSELDSNFTNLNTDKLERNGSIAMTGNLNLNSNSITNVVNFTASGTVTGGTFSGSGASLTSLNGSQITTGTIPVARLNGGTTGQFVRGDGAYSNTLTGQVKIGAGAASNSSTLMVNNPNATATGIQLFQDGQESWVMGLLASSTALTWANSGSEKMRLDATGSLGIGTTSPISGAGLTIGNDGNGNATVKAAFSTSATERASVQMNGASGEMRLTAGYAGYGGFLSIHANGAERGRFDNLGNFALGTTNAGTAGLSISQSFNLSWEQSATESIATIFRQASSGALVLASGYKRSGTANGFASSIASSWAKNAISLGTVTGAISFYTDTAAAVAVGTDITPTERMRIASAGNVTVYAPSSGTALTVNGITANNAISCTDGTTTFVVQPNATSGTLIGTTTANATRLISNGSIRVDIASAGNVTVNAPGSGVGLTVNGGGIAVTGNSTITGTLGGISTLTATTFSGALSGNATTATTLQTARTLWGQSFDGSANVTGAAALPLASTVDGVAIGYRSIPRSTTTTTATTSDVGKCIAVSANITIPNSTFAAGDAVSIYNDSAAAITITAGVTTLRQAGTTNTGNRTLAPRGMATIWFNSATEAVISGPGVS